MKMNQQQQNLPLRKDSSQSHQGVGWLVMIIINEGCLIETLLMNTVFNQTDVP